MDVFPKLMTQTERLIGRHCPLGNHAFFSPALFPWSARLEQNWQSMRAELDGVLARKTDIPNFQDVSPEQVALTTDHRWKTFFFYVYGHKNAANCARCPVTTELVESVPGMRTAFFSILDSGKSIPPHRGPYKGVLRYHLGLKVAAPQRRAGILVNNQSASWEEGKSLVFDDTYQHEAWNYTRSERVVLFMDFVRPLPLWLSVWNRALLGAMARTKFIRQARSNQERLAQTLEHKWQQG